MKRKYFLWTVLIISFVILVSILLKKEFLLSPDPTKAEQKCVCPTSRIRNLTSESITITKNCPTNIKICTDEYCEIEYKMRPLGDGDPVLMKDKLKCVVKK